MSDANARDSLTYREFAERYAGMISDGTEKSSLWDQPVPERELNLAAEGRRLSFTVIEGGEPARDGCRTCHRNWTECVC